MAQVHDNLKVGDRVTWNSVNGTPSGIVEAVDEHGVLVRLPSGKYTILATPESLNYERERRKHIGNANTRNKGRK